MRKTYKVTVTERAHRTIDVYVRSDSEHEAVTAVNQHYEMDELDFNETTYETEDFFIDGVEKTDD